MPSKYPILKPKDIIYTLEKLGFFFVSQKGIHLKYSNGIRTTIIPNHKEVARGTLQSILELAGFSLDVFLEQLK